MSDDEYDLSHLTKLAGSGKGETELDLNALACFYEHMEVPEAIPVPGWSLVVSEGGAFEHIPRWGFKLTDEAKEWCDINLTGEYWFLGEAIASTYPKRLYEIFFTLEQDYIFFKMRWG